MSAGWLKKRKLLVLNILDVFQIVSSSMRQNATPAMRPSAAADRPLTEVDGGTPAPALDPNPTLERFDPKATFIFTDQAAGLEASRCITVPMESSEAVAATNQSNQSSITVPGEFYGIDEVSYCLATAPPWPQVRRPADRLTPGGP